MADHLALHIKRMIIAVYRNYFVAEFSGRKPRGFRDLSAYLGRNSKFVTAIFSKISAKI